ncbi:MAG TPA: hypothetical protein VEC99_13170 [Clostridia bacterium]|nr:hypothetical protein [Clostridia bacterium]
MSEPDQYELYLTARMSAGRLCEIEGFNKVDLFNVLSGLQDAHDRILKREASKFLVGLVQGLGAGKVTAAQVKELFDIEPEAIGELVKWLETAKPSQPPETKCLHCNERLLTFSRPDGKVYLFQCPKCRTSFVIGRTGEKIDFPWSSSDIHKQIREADLDEP